MCLGQSAPIFISFQMKCANRTFILSVVATKKNSMFYEQKSLQFF